MHLFSFRVCMNLVLDSITSGSQSGLDILVSTWVFSYWVPNDLHSKSSLAKNSIIQFHAVGLIDKNHTYGQITYHTGWLLWNISSAFFFFLIKVSGAKDKGKELTFFF